MIKLSTRLNEWFFGKDSECDPIKFMFLLYEVRELEKKVKELEKRMAE